MFVPEEGAGRKGPPPKSPQLRALGQHIRSLSFKNLSDDKTAAAASANPNRDVNVQVNLDARKTPGADRYEVLVKLDIETKIKPAKDSGEAPTVLFTLAIEYVGLFQVDNVPKDKLHPMLMIEGPRLMFPFLRRIVNDVTQDGGVLPLNLENIDFVSIYRSVMAQRQASSSQGGTSGANPGKTGKPGVGTSEN